MPNYVELTDDAVALIRAIHKSNDRERGALALSYLFGVARVRVERVIDRKTHKHVPLSASKALTRLTKDEIARRVDAFRTQAGLPPLAETPQPRQPRRTARQIQYAEQHGENAPKAYTWFKQPKRKLKHYHPDGIAPADLVKRNRWIANIRETMQRRRELGLSRPLTDIEKRPLHDAHVRALPPLHDRHVWARQAARVREVRRAYLERQK